MSNIVITIVVFCVMFAIGVYSFYWLLLCPDERQDDIIRRLDDITQKIDAIEQALKQPKQ